MKMNMKHWWNDPDKGKPKYWDKNPSLCQFEHHKYHVDWAGMELDPPARQVGDWHPEPVI